MANQEPKRWGEIGSDAPPALQQLLSAARRDLPSQDELRAMGMLGGVAGLLEGDADLAGPASKTAPIDPGTTAASASGSFAKVALLAKLGVSGLVVAGGVTWFVQSRKPMSDIASTPSTTSAVQVVQSAQAVAPEVTALPQAPPDGVSSSPAAPDADAANDGTASDGTAGNGARSPRPTAPSSAASPPSEASLLQRAQASLASDPERALKLTEQHQRLFPEGQLAQEREVIRIEALRRLGRGSQAEKVGRDFERQFPDSPHRRKLEQSEP